MNPLLNIALITATLHLLMSVMYYLVNLMAIFICIAFICFIIIVCYGIKKKSEDPDDGVIFKSVVTITRRIKADDEEETEDEEEDEENTPDTPEAPGPDTPARTETHKPASL